MFCGGLIAMIYSDHGREGMSGRSRCMRRNSARRNKTLSMEGLESKRLMAVDLLANNLTPPTSATDSIQRDSIPSIDGTGNNVLHPDWGSTDIGLLRMSETEYSDGIYLPAGDDRVGAREVSNGVAAQNESLPNDRGLTDMTWLWGQFIDHDISLTEGADPAEAFNIAVPMGDSYFDPYGTGTQEISLSRSAYLDGSGHSIDSPRTQVNQITAFIDGSVVYGSDEERSHELRTLEGGLLKTSEGNLLPFNLAGLENAGGTGDSLFIAGDVRANENVALSSMHTIWVREHNRIAREIAAENPELSDEQLYQRARRLVTAQLQAITYREFLPALLGENALSPYQGYDPNVDPGISNVFSTAIYRFGHSMLSTELMRLDNDGSTAEEGHLSLSSAFFAPDEITANGIDSLLLGAASQVAQEIDTRVVDDVRNFLFGPPGSGGFDLVSLNIQRGRDHGLADYNQVREDVGLDRVKTFDQITSDPELAAELERLYGNVDNVDAWVGSLAEDHVRGASVGELAMTVMVDQFKRLRDGDRFWYQNRFSGSELRQIENTTLADVIKRNTEITKLSDNVFFIDGWQETRTDGNPPPVRPPRASQPASFDRNRRGERRVGDTVNDRLNRPVSNSSAEQTQPRRREIDRTLPPPPDSRAPMIALPNDIANRNDSESSRDNGNDTNERNRIARQIAAIDLVFSEQSRLHRLQ